METLRKEIIDYIDMCLKKNPNQMYAIEMAQTKFNMPQEEVAKVYQKHIFKQEKKK